MPSQQHQPWAYTLPAALLLLAPFNILASLGMDIYLPIVPAMTDILDTSASVVQLTLSLYMIGLGLGQVVLGPLSDRIGRRPVLLGGALLFAVASCLLASTSSATVFLGLRLLQAAGASATLVAIFATVRDVYGEQPQSATVYGLLNAMLAFVPAFGPIAGALIAEVFGWRAVFIALGAPALAALLYAVPRWHETRPGKGMDRKGSFLPVLRSGRFWTYTLGFSAAMGAFFVFFSTAPRILIDRAGFSELGFSMAFATAALVMVAAARFVTGLVEKWGTAGSLVRAMAMLLAGAGLLALGQLLLPPSFCSFVLPMWIIAVGIVLASSVTANGALQEFGDIAGTAVALYFCIQSIITGTLGTALVLLLGGDTAWPLAGYSAGMAVITSSALRRLQGRDAATQPA